MFTYDAFQKQAIQYIDEGHSVIVSAPTGAGKTVIAEYVIEECLRKGRKVIYTAPIKALSNQKFRDFQEKNSDVGILTGDVSLNSKAQLLIMTTEIFRNKILEGENNLSEYDWIIFDEIHYLDDHDRGTVWEESLIFLPDHMNILGLSATVPNVEELKDWIESIHHKTVKIVKEEKRPVPLHMYFQCQDRIYDDFQKMVKGGYTIPGQKHPISSRMSRHLQIKPNSHITLIGHLQKEDMLPCVYFAFSRKRTEMLAEDLYHFNFLSSEDQHKILLMFDELCERFDLTAEPSAAKIRPLVRRGIAYHHAGMLPTLKETIERLFTSRMIKVIFTTETFALGINMPARSVIFDELSKFYGKGFEVLRTRDFFQMAGRAGRRSIDTEGHVFCRVDPHFITPYQVQKSIFGEPEKVFSQFNASYATVLNLYQTYGDRLYDIYPRSFHYYQAGRANRKKAIYFMRAKVDILKELECIKNGKLTPKGEFASRVYGYELVLSELFNMRILEHLSVEQLGILILAVIYEPRKGQQKPELQKSLKGLEKEVKQIVKDINRLEKIVGLKDFTKQCYFHLTPAMQLWINGRSFHEMLEYTDADEGEIVRYLRMTIQVLREVMEAPISKGLKQKMYELITAINRDVIDSEKQLRS